MRKLTLLVLSALLLVAWTGTDCLVSPGRDNVKYLEFEEVFRVGDNPMNEEEIFNMLSRSLLDKERQLYLSDFGEKRIQVFDKNGKFLFTLGRKGQGPGEFAWFGGIFSDHADNVVIHDGRGLKLIYMNRNGKHIRDDYYGHDFEKRIFYPKYLSTGELLFCSKKP